MYLITREDPASPAAVGLIVALSDTLARITGDSGRSSFDPDDVRGEKARFVVARTPSGTPVGCGAFRPLDSSVAELKRMFAVPGHPGAGSALLAHLEVQAHSLAYHQLWLATRLVNVRAVSFYEKRGYGRVANFGRYAGRPETACFAKVLRAPGLQAVVCPPAADVSVDRVRDSLSPRIPARDDNSPFSF